MIPIEPVVIAIRERMTFVEKVRFSLDGRPINGYTRAQAESLLEAIERQRLASGEDTEDMAAARAMLVNIIAEINNRMAAPLRRKG